MKNTLLSLLTSAAFIAPTFGAELTTPDDGATSTTVASQTAARQAVIGAYLQDVAANDDLFQENLSDAKRLAFEAFLAPGSLSEGDMQKYIETLLRPLSEWDFSLTPNWEIAHSMLLAIGKSTEETLSILARWSCVDYFHFGSKTPADVLTQLTDTVGLSQPEASVAKAALNGDTPTSEQLRKTAFSLLRAATNRTIDYPALLLTYALVEKGADIFSPPALPPLLYSRSYLGVLPLVILANQDSTLLGLLFKLAVKNSNINQQDEAGRTVLSRAVTSSPTPGQMFLPVSTQKLVDMLLKSGANPAIADNKGIFPLQYALSSLSPVDRTKYTNVLEQLKAGLTPEQTKQALAATN